MKPSIKATFETKDGKYLRLVRLDNATQVIVNDHTPNREVRRVGDAFTTGDVDSIRGIAFSLRRAK